jgi:hypothetical protein
VGARGCGLQPSHVLLGNPSKRRPLGVRGILYRVICGILKRLVAFIRVSELIDLGQQYSLTLNLPGRTVPLM